MKRRHYIAKHLTQKNKHKKCFAAFNPYTKRTFAKCTSRRKARRQRNYLDEWLKLQLHQLHVQ